MFKLNLKYVHANQNWCHESCPNANHHIKVLRGLEIMASPTILDASRRWVVETTFRLFKPQGKSPQYLLEVMWTMKHFWMWRLLRRHATIEEMLKTVFSLDPLRGYMTRPTDFYSVSLCSAIEYSAMRWTGWWAIRELLQFSPCEPLLLDADSWGTGIVRELRVRRKSVVVVVTSNVWRHKKWKE
jgi:hypothetical protein